MMKVRLHICVQLAALNPDTKLENYFLSKLEVETITNCQHFK